MLSQNLVFHKMYAHQNSLRLFQEQPCLWSNLLNNYCSLVLTYIINVQDSRVVNKRHLSNGFAIFISLLNFSTLISKVLSTIFFTSAFHNAWWQLTGIEKVHTYKIGMTLLLIHMFDYPIKGKASGTLVFFKLLYFF